MGNLFDSGLLVFVKIIELVAGLALVSGFFTPLALMMLAPIIVNIFYFHLTLDPAGIPIGILLVVLAVLVANGYRNVFFTLLQLCLKRTDGPFVRVSVV